MSHEHNHEHLELFGAGHRFRSQDGNHQVLCDSRPTVKTLLF